MKILFTGASSFTGYWFVKELTSKGHEVAATFLRDYSGIRKLRVDKLLDCCHPHYTCPFGSSAFLDILSKNSFDVLCHHAAYVENYKSQDFNVAKAFSNNTNQLNEVLKLFKENGGKKIVITGSVFEKGEGAGTKPLEAFSPYGLSKTFTSDYFEYLADRLAIPLFKFVIPNPFGPFEEERFTTWLVSNWILGKCPEIKTPSYVRDNIHISLLAKAYVDFVGRKPIKQFTRLNPSGYVSTQGEFVKRFANQMRDHLNLRCGYKLLTQTEFNEPLERYNTDQISDDEEKVWKELADYYKTRFLRT